MGVVLGGPYDEFRTDRMCPMKVTLTEAYVGSDAEGLAKAMKAAREKAKSPDLARTPWAPDDRPLAADLVGRLGGRR